MKCPSCNADITLKTEILCWTRGAQQPTMEPPIHGGQYDSDGAYIPPRVTRCKQCRRTPKHCICAAFNMRRDRDRYGLEHQAAARVADAVPDRPDRVQWVHETAQHKWTEINGDELKVWNRGASFSFIEYRDHKFEIETDDVELFAQFLAAGLLDRFTL